LKQDARAIASGSSHLPEEDQFHEDADATDFDREVTETSRTRTIQIPALNKVTKSLGFDLLV